MNKIENKRPNVHVLSLASYVAPELTESKDGDYVQYGDKNSYYKFLIDRYTNSATNNAVINGVSRLIYGKGLTALDAASKPNDYASFITMFKSEDVRKLVVDLKMLGQCAMQVLYSKDHKKVISVQHISVHLICPEKCNKEGKIANYYYSDNWDNVKEYAPMKVPAFNTSNSDTEILFVKPYSVGMKYFSGVDYQGGLPYATLEEEIAQYLITETQNSFSGTKIVNVNGGRYTDEQQDDISNKIKSSLTGSKGQKVIVAFNENQELATTVVDIPLNDAPKHYEYLSTESRDKILTAHNVTSPLMFGIITGTGFSSNADELATSMTAFDNTIVRSFQDLLIDAFDSILAFNNITLKLQFKTLNPFENSLGTENQDNNVISGINSLSPLVANKVLESMTANEIRALVGLSAEVGGGDLNPATVLSSQKSALQIILDECEDADQKDWIIVDSRDVELEDEDVLNNHINSLNSELCKKLNKQTVLSKLVNLVSTGTARPTAISGQDKVVKEKYFKVRYRYTGNKSPERDFCNAMLNANKLYRKEDIDKMSSQIVNAGFGEFGADVYDIFKYKGGPRCHHKFERVTMMYDFNNDEAGLQEIGTRAAEIKGFKVTNPFEVSIYPNNLPLKGFSPNNKNLPSDV
jgi:hypothetical protein